MNLDNYPIVYYNVRKDYKIGEYIMEFLNVLSLLVLGFMLIFYGFMANRSENNVSFFLCVGLICFIANLCTISGGAWLAAILFLIIGLGFLGLGFVVNRHKATEFYTSIGPWFKKTFTNKSLIGWQALSMIVPPAGAVLYFVWYKNEAKHDVCLECGRNALWGILLWLCLIWLIVGMINGHAAPEVTALL